MLPYKSLIQVDRSARLSLHIQVCNSFISLITSGTLQPNDILPGSRVLAQLIGINRNTVKLAYDELISQGWAESIERKGIFVLSKLPLRSKTPVIPATANHAEAGTFDWNNNLGPILPNEQLQQVTLAIDDGFPDVRLAPVDVLMREYRSLSRKFYGKGFLKYSTAMGSEQLRLAIQRYLAHSRGLIVSPDQLMITKGSQMGIYLAARLLLNPGDGIAVGVCNYGSADDTFRNSGAKLLRISVDDQGMDIDELKKALQRQKIKAVYVIPHHHFPTTVTMSMERRLKLLNLAKEYRFAIIEDDYDFDFHYDNKPFLPLASIDHNHQVIYIGSISKTFAPALRIGFMSGPPAFVKAAASLRQLIDKQGDTLLEEALATLYNEGEMDRHFRRSLKIYRQRRNSFCEILKADFGDTIQFRVPEGGLGIWANFDPNIDLIKMSDEAARKGLYIGNGSYYQNENFSPNAQRIGFASLRENEMTEALSILKKVIYKL
ncbi:PLP-dependent aminotransferase family protein [Mucilaginibacter sabulilitoris]|uniref:PLP-dependent aminotransferase family protein n=1 Tax=Mucilaginibacter sabulilitoris TaxID=1173583 RepID=A0ABZ0TLD6_9SPHI|nr:PLP-dependent aminotransferase family protein [Mucilaginibacter sabulilitoris]WPU93616.1 PLP-dependent aminotransferase family protein [Mucilaginibacter sabulilitoris]